jgi:hypothetical protein
MKSTYVYTIDRSEIKFRGKCHLKLVADASPELTGRSAETRCMVTFPPLGIRFWDAERESVDFQW